MRSQRGFTIAEVLTVMVIVGLILGSIAMAMPLFLKAPTEAQLQVDNVQTAALALYKVQRDLRQSDPSGIFSCSMPPLVVCTTANGPPSPTPALVVLTADNPSGEFKPNANGGPDWQGFNVYWLTPNSDGTSNDLKRAYFPDPIWNFPVLSLGTQEATAAVVLTTVLTTGSAVTVATHVRQLSVSVDKTSNIAGLQLDGGDLTGNVSRLSLTSNTYVRN